MATPAIPLVDVNPDYSWFPRVWESTSPAAGEAILTFFQEPLSTTGPFITLRVHAKPWVKTDQQPFAWTYLPPMGERTYPILRVVVARHVTLTQTGSLDGRTEKQMRVGGLLSGIIFDDKNPLIDIIRPQNEALIPDPDDQVDVYRVVGAPWQSIPDYLYEYIPGQGFVDPPAPPFPITDLTSVAVAPNNRGVRISNLKGLFNIEVRVKRIDRPAAYAYELLVLSGLSFFVNVVHTSNIKISVELHEDLILHNNGGVFAKQVSKTSQVPQQGSVIEDDGLKFVKPDHVIYSQDTQQAIIAFEIIVGFIPYAGVLYDIAQLAYMAETGKNFWGQRISDLDKAVMAAMIILPMGSASASTLRSVRRIAKARGISKALERATVEKIASAVDTAFVEAVGTLGPKAHKKLLLALESYQAGRISVKALMKEYDKVLGKAYLAKIENSLISRVFNRNFKSFSDPQLAEAYQKYVSRKLRKSQKPADPGSWAKQQNKVKKSASLARLRQLMGDDYVGVIDRGIKSGQIPRRVTELDIKNYDRILSAGPVTNYDSLRTIVKEINEGNPLGARVSDHFEMDHLLERRFWRNNNSLESAFDEKGLAQAMLVPKNAYVAAEMFRNHPGHLIRFVHATKTRMMKRLIPHRAEALFAQYFGEEYIQHLYYAHVHVLKSLDVPDSVIRAMGEDFALMAEELGQSFVKNTPDPKIFLHKNGWPRIWEDPSNPESFLIIGKQRGVF